MFMIIDSLLIVLTLHMRANKQLEIIMIFHDS